MSGDNYDTLRRTQDKLNNTLDLLEEARERIEELEREPLIVNNAYDQLKLEAIKRNFDKYTLDYLENPECYK